MTATIAYATPDDLETLVPLFDAYRMFYRQPSDTALARAFLRERLVLRESVILLARDAADGEALGFVQLYPAFTSVAAQRLWILNDLFVVGAARGRGIGRALLERAERHAVDTGALRLSLSTAESNHPAQALYESCGWERDSSRHYDRSITDPV